MATSEAAIEGIRAHGMAWKRGTAGIAELAKQLGEINDDERDHTEAQGIAKAIAKRLRGYRTSSADMRRSLYAAAEELECVADCEIDEINYAMNHVYDALDYWRILA